MKKTITALAGAACLLCAATAQAGVYRFDFTATGVHNVYGLPTPESQNSVNGSITFTADSLSAPITKINNVDLTIAGHVYTVEEIGTFRLSDESISFGGLVYGVTGIGPDGNYNDFRIDSHIMSYTVSEKLGYWQGFDVVSSYTELVAEVPEPNSLALLLAGAGGLGALLRRRRRA